jgi:predicted O-linked N-acetylglucosamine transferase (SPINDLY family)
LDQALQLDPFDKHARLFLGVAHSESGVPGRALDALDALVRDSDDPHMHSQRAWAMLKQGRVEEALAAFDVALALDPRHPVVNWNRLFALQHRVGMDAATLYEAHTGWATRAQAPSSQGSPAPGARRRLNGLPTLGIVSGDLRRHAVSSLTLPVFEALRRRGFEIVCFANQAEDDDHSKRYQAISRSWRMVEKLNDEELRTLILNEEIDILFDLAGMTNRHRLLVFAARAAPLQVTWAGYVGTTGLAEMDALIADEREVPTGEDRFYTERIIRLPDCYTCYEPPDEAPEIGPPPCIAAGHIMFGAFHRLPKFNVDVAEVWARILKALPDSRLLLHYGGFADQQAQSVFTKLFQSAGLLLEQVIFEDGADPADMQRTYNRVDVFLDTWPYSGGVTTLEASWMGVPVVTLPGRTFAGRHSKSHLTAIGLTETIASDKEDYVRIALGLARDVERRAFLRANLRQMVQASPLCDPDRFAGNLSDALLRLWEEKLEAAEREHLNSVIPA